MVGTKMTRPRTAQKTLQNDGCYMVGTKNSPKDGELNGRYGNKSAQGMDDTKIARQRIDG